MSYGSRKAVRGGQDEHWKPPEKERARSWAHPELRHAYEDFDPAIGMREGGCTTG
jgi:hypothetical protein